VVSGLWDHASLSLSTSVSEGVSGKRNVGDMFSVNPIDGSTETSLVVVVVEKVV